MYLLSIVLLCYVLLFIASSSESRGNSINGDEQRDNSTVRYDLFVNSMKNRDNKMQLYNLLENSTKDDEMHHEFHTKIYRSILQNDSILQELNENLIKTVENASYEFYKNSNIDDHNNSLTTIVSYEACDNKTCIQLCCPFGDYLTSERNCIAGQDNYSFPDIYQNDSKNKKLDELFQLTVHDPCVQQGSAYHILNPNEYLLLVNGSVYRDPDGELIPSTSYCLAVLDRNVYDVIICMRQIGFPTYLSVCLLVSLPFLLLTFVVYSILPQLHNVHGYTLRVYVASLFVTNMIIFFVHKIPELSEWKYCIPLGMSYFFQWMTSNAYIFNFSIMSACFWLNAMCFDIWWTFRKLKLDQVNVQHERKKKFVIYSIYAWGITFAFCVICAIMDYAPGIPKYLIRPKMCKNKFWFGHDDALTVYYYAPMGVAYVSNIFFFIATTVTILYHNKHTVHRMTDSENHCCNKKKRKFSMCLQLFIVMGISWIIGTILWLIHVSNPLSSNVWNVNYTIDILRGPIIFIIYVCKKKILRLLLKRFGLHDCNLLFWNISASNRTRTSSNTSSLTSSVSKSISMQQIGSSHQQINHHAESNK